MYTAIGSEYDTEILFGERHEIMNRNQTFLTYIGYLSFVYIIMCAKYEQNLQTVPTKALDHFKASRVM
jgi:hypothetical protein